MFNFDNSLHSFFYFHVGLHIYSFNECNFSFSINDINAAGASRPEIKQFHFSGSLKSGKRSSVMCTVVDGDPPFKFSWLKDGKEITEGNSVTIRQIDDYASTLVITNLGPDHNGNYTCRVSNAAGMDQHSDMLLMRSKKFYF